MAAHLHFGEIAIVVLDCFQYTAMLGNSACAPTPDMY
jgi:hypothetical protein